MTSQRRDILKSSQTSPFGGLRGPVQRSDTVKVLKFKNRAAFPFLLLVPFIILTTMILAACSSSSDEQASSEPAPAEAVAQPAPPSPTPTPPPPPQPDSASVAEINARPPSEGFPEFAGVKTHRIPLQNRGRLLWAVFSLGVRQTNLPQNHQLAIYSYRDNQWEALAQIELINPDVLTETSLKQVNVEPSHIWLVVEGGQGASAGCFDLLSFDDQQTILESQVSHCNPDIGSNQLTDLNNDGVPEVILNNNDRYVFCGACGVVWTQANILRWDGSRMVSVFLQTLPDDAPAELHKLNNQAIEAAWAELWLDAHDLIQEARALDNENPILFWNAVHINENATLREAQATEGAYPLLGQIFYGDYTAALDVMRAFDPEQIFTAQTPLIIGTPAEGFEQSLATRIINHTNEALALKPDLAAAYFLRAWATFLENTESLDVFIDLKQAVKLQPDDALFGRSLAYLENAMDPKIVTQVERLILGRTELKPLVEAELDEANGFDEIIVLPLSAPLDSPPLWAAFSTVFSTPEEPHFIAVYTIRDEEGWEELDWIELEGDNEAGSGLYPALIAETSVAQVNVTLDRVWLAVNSGAGANQSCYDLLGFDGEDLIREISACTGWGDLIDLNEDGTPEVVIDERDLYVFAGRGLMTELHFAYWHWDGENMVELAPRLLPRDAPREIRDMNNNAVALAEASLWLDARNRIEEAQRRLGNQRNPVVAWNAAIINHRLNVSEREAAAYPSAYPLLSAVFDGDYRQVVDLMKVYSPSELFSLETPLIFGTPAAGNEAALIEELKDHTTRALHVRPDLAPAYFLRAWALYFEDPANPQVLDDLEQAIELKQDEKLFKEGLDYVQRQQP